VKWQPTRAEVLRTLAVSSFALFALLASWADVKFWGDHDQFLSFIETDVQGWLLAHRPPVWSYPLCGGTTRIGDPQAFGLSPLIVPPLLLGSVLGIAVVKLLCLGLGWLGGMQILKSLGVKEGSTRAASACLFITGQFLFAHLTHGHLTFALYGLVVFLFSRLLVALESGLDKKGFVGVAFFGACYLLSGFYHSFVFFAGPLGLCVLAAGRWLGKEGLKFAVAAGVAVALAAPRLYAIAVQQGRFPRSYPQSLMERISPLELARYLLLPSMGPAAENLGTAPGFGFELLFFTWIPLLFVATLALGRRAPEALPSGRVDAFARQVGIAAVGLGLLLSLGNFAPFAPFTLLNRLSSSAIRGVPRFTFLPTFGLFLLWGRQLRRAHAQRLEWLLVAGLVANCLLVSSWIADLDFRRPMERLGYPNQPLAQRRTLRWIESKQYERRPRSGPMDRMFETLKDGDGVANCRQAIWFPKRHYDLKPEAYSEGRFPDTRTAEFYFLMRPDGAALSEECQRRSYFTQDEIVVDPSCGKDICTLLNDIDPADTRWTFRDEAPRICLKK